MSNTTKQLELCRRRSRSGGAREIVNGCSTSMRIIGFLVTVVVAATSTSSSSCFCDAFSSHQIFLPILSRINNVVHISNSGRSSPSHNLQQQQRSTYSRLFPTTTTRLYVAKTGGKMIDTEDQFAEVVLAKDVPRPVLVFFSAPW